jgi:hypothetical protein
LPDVRLCERDLARLPIFRLSGQQTLSQQIVIMTSFKQVFDCSSNDPEAVRF